MRCDYQPNLTAVARRADYLNFVPEPNKIELEILLEAIYKADPEKAKFIHFPFWTQDQDGKAINWYLEYRNRTWWWRIKNFVGLCDDIIAVNFLDGQANVMSRIDAGLSTFERSHNLRDPNSFQNLGNHIIKLLT